MKDNDKNTNLLEDLIDNKPENVSIEEYFSNEQILNNLQSNEQLMTQEKSHFINPSTKNLSRLSKIRRSNMFIRLFHSMNEGSLRGVTLLFVRMTLGVGVLTLPYYMKQFGGLLGVVVLLLAGLINYWTYAILAEVGNEHGIPDFLLLAKKFTPPFVSKLFKVLYLVDLVSVMIFFTILLYNVFGYLMAFTNLVPDEWFEDKDKYKYKEYSKPMITVRGIYLIVSFFVVLPFLFKKDLGALKTISNYYLTVLMTFVLFILIEMIFFRLHYEKQGNFTVDYIISKPKISWIESFFAVFLSYYSQTYFFALRNELMHPTTKRLKKLSLYSCALMFLFFTILSVVCYFGLGNENMPDIVILRTPYKGKPKWSETMFRVLICIFFFMSLVSIPLFNPPIRDYIFSEFDIENTRKNWIIVSISPFILGCVLCLASPSIIAAWNFFGITVYNFNG